MKKIFYLLITLLLFSTFKVYAADATITDLSCTKKTGGVESTLTATVNGLDINIGDVFFDDVGDFMKCTFKINNTSDDDLEVDISSIEDKSDDKITYSLTSSNGNIIKKGESNTYNLDIEYVGAYTESRTIDNEIEISLVGDTISVPDTFITSFAIILYVVLLGAGLAIMIITNKKAKLLVLVLLLLIMPSAYALTKISIKMTNKIIVDTSPKYDVTYYINYSSILTEEEANNSDINFEKAIFTDSEEGFDYYEVYHFGDDPTPYYLYEADNYTEQHKAGRTVELLDFHMYIVDTEGCQFTGITEGESIKEFNLSCSVEREEIPVFNETNPSYWEYASETDESNELQFAGDSGDFTPQYVNVNGAPRYVITALPNDTFVMPNHPMTFSKKGTK